MEQGQVKSPGGRLIPPYVSYNTFRTFVGGFKKGPPGRIDRGLMAHMSGAIQGQLIAALKYLGLMSPEGLRTERFVALAKSEGAERQNVLRQTLEASYSYLFRNFDLETATGSQIREQFQEVGASGDTVRKCLAFFMAACKEAGIPLSPYMESPRRPQTGSKRRGRRAAPQRVEGTLSNATNAEDSNPEAVVPLPAWPELLLAKFPDFNPEWPDEVKAKWFDAFEKLMRLAQTGIDDRLAKRNG